MQIFSLSANPKNSAIIQLNTFVYTCEQSNEIEMGQEYKKKKVKKKKI